MVLSQSRLTAMCKVIDYSRVRLFRADRSDEEAEQPDEWPASSGLSPQPTLLLPSLLASRASESQLSLLDTCGCPSVAANPAGPRLVSHFPVSPTFTFGRQALKMHSC